MRSLELLMRARARLVAPLGRHAGRRLAGAMAIVAVSFAAVLVGSALAPALTGGAGERAGSGAGLGGPAPSTSASQPPSTAASPVPSTAPGSATAASRSAGSGGASPTGVQRELASRLDEILRLRELAYARRDATVLESIYTADCACRRSGRAAIARLLADHAVWRGRSVSVRVERLSRVNDSLWIALAVLRRGAFRIEGEDGTLLRAEPAARQRYRFALVRTGTGTWLLGHASLVGELPP